MAITEKNMKREGSPFHPEDKVTVSNLTKIFYKKKEPVVAIENLSFTIKEGEFVCLIGPSGCGKTTLLRILAGLETPSTGEVILKHKDREKPLQSMIFQENGVIPWMTVEENVSFGLRMRKVPKEVIKQRTEYYLEKIGLAKFARLYPKELSGGMKQRASIARAFANDPEILFMDEPFASLDEQNKFILQNELLNIWEETGKTVLFITHSLDEALLLSDRIILMSAHPGRIVAEKRITKRRPRTMEEIRSDPGMNALFVKMWNHLQREVTRSRGIKESESMD
ncbi:MAG: ABC transporter ATP-binding protein [Thermicanus sp.]|nr:ABC transporter ATP-binding protein [Thermicanus sp.]